MTNPADSTPPADAWAASLLDDPGRAAVARTAVEQVAPDMALGLGSGRAVWAALHVLGQQPWSQGLRVATASVATEQRARALGLQIVQLDGTVHLDLVIDGADEVDGELNLLKGHGAALLREKLIALNARRFVVIAEISKLVDHLGQQKTLPIEVVRFAWPDTRHRLLDLFDEVTLRTDDGNPRVTDEGHYLLHATMPPAADLPALATEVACTVGVVEHGLFLGMANEALLGSPDGQVDVRRRL